MKTMRAAQKRVLVLAKRARLFNMHHDHGHRQRKTNWWK
jgi:hypothetical protein